MGGLTASRLLDSSADLQDVRDCLGHANITTTSRYARCGWSSALVALEQEVASDDAQRARFSARAADSTSGAAAHPREP